MLIRRIDGDTGVVVPSVRDVVAKIHSHWAAATPDGQFRIAITDSGSINIAPILVSLEQ